MHTFSITEAVKFSWDTVKKNLGFFIAMSLLVLGVSFGAEIIDEFQPLAEFSTLSFLLYLFLLVLNLLLTIWVVRVGIDAVDKKQLSFASIATSWEVVWKFILSNIVIGLIVLIPASFLLGVVIALGVGSVFGGLMSTPAFGMTTVLLLGALLIFFVLALVYIGTRFMFASYYVVDQKLGPIESVKASWRVSRGVVWKLVLLSILLGLINIVGMLALFVGLLVTIPITYVATAYVYRALAGGHDSVPTPAGESVEPVPVPEMGNV